MLRKRMWDNFVPIGEVQKAQRSKIVVSAAIREGFRYINIREFYFSGRLQMWLPSREGISLPLIVPVDKGERMLYPYRGVRNLIQLAAEKVAGMELFDEAHAIYMPEKEKP